MLRIELDKQSIIAAGGKVEIELRGKEFSSVLHFKDRKIDIPSTGQCHLYLGSSLATDVPLELADFVSDITFYDNFGYDLEPKRRLGQYRLGKAVAELDVVGGANRHYHVKMRATNLSDMRQLYELIRQGQIWPAKDYEANQVPPPYRHFRDLLKEAWQLMRRDIKDRLYRIKDRIAH